MSTIIRRSTRPLNLPPHHLTGVLVLCVLLASTFLLPFVHSQEQASWQTCATFMAPSIETSGWAVYAGRSFKKDEIVELTPFFIPLETDQTQSSVLDTYVLEFPRDGKLYHAVLLGNGGFYNHHPNPNLMYVEVVAKGDGIPHSIGFRATRDITAGEQLYVNYGMDGDKWFAKRGLDAAKHEQLTKLDAEILPLYLSSHCSKAYGGVGLPTWRDRIQPILPKSSHWMDMTRLAPFDAGLGDARAKVDIGKGSHIEKSLGLVVSRNAVRGTPLGVLAFYWENMKIDHHQHLINLRDDEKLILQYQGQDTNWESVDRFQGYSEITVLPISGIIGLVRRAGHDERSNCKLLIRSNKDHLANNVGVTLELVATEDIMVGEVLILNIAPSEFEEEYHMLHDEMEASGQPHHPSIFDNMVQEEL
jgi:hypothetical protein